MKIREAKDKQVMSTLNANWKCGLAVGLCLSSVCFTAGAAEGISPLQPGATTGNPAGALPPPGVYLSVDANYEWGNLQDGSANDRTEPKIKIGNVSSVANLTYVPGWEVLGASYAMSVAQPYKWADTEVTVGGSSTTITDDGNVNTVFVPAILSWNLGEGLFLGTGFAFYLDNGADGIGNNYYTFEPNVAISYLNNGWNLTANNIFDFNTKNKDNDYQTGNFYYLDLTATKSVDKWTYGFIGNYTQQFTDDKQNGTTLAAIDGVRSEGNRAQHVLAGGMLGYNFGSFSLNTRLLYSLRAENDADVSFIHVGLSMPL